jgi:hypothetical protein
LIRLVTGLHVPVEGLSARRAEDSEPVRGVGRQGAGRGGAARRGTSGSSVGRGKPRSAPPAGTCRHGIPQGGLMLPWIGKTSARQPGSRDVEDETAPDPRPGRRRLRPAILLVAPEMGSPWR